MQKQPQFRPQDGTSQAGRVLKALDPNYVSVDERSIKDLLGFAQEYARELRYFNEDNQWDGDWSGFLGKNGLGEIIAYLKDPQQFRDDSQKRARLSRPHLTLFLTFLELLQYARSQLNGLTRKHLEFYYREALRLTSRQGVPDRVHVLAELADGQEQFLLPRGTLFQAGQDGLGQPVFYQSEEDLVANQAAVENVKSLFAEKQVIGIAEARQNPDVLIELFPDDRVVLEEGSLEDRSFLAMLMMALGSDVPGAKLAPYPGTPIVDSAWLRQLDALLAFVPDVLFMPLSNFRTLMELKAEQTREYEKQWPVVNNYLREVARRRLGNPGLPFEPAAPANFEANFLAALGRPAWGDLFNELPEVQDIYDVYRRSGQDEVKEFIGNSLYMNPNDFNAMMEIVEGMNDRWRQIYEILRAAGRKKQAAESKHELEPPEIRTYMPLLAKFVDLVHRTLDTLDYSSLSRMDINNLDAVNRAIVMLEDYFHLLAEEFVFIRRINVLQNDAHPWEWQQVYAILEGAHVEKLVSVRRKVLEGMNEDVNKGFDFMIRFALGDPGDDLPLSKRFEDLDAERDKDYLSNDLFLEPANFTYIRDVQSKGGSATADEWANVYTIIELAQRRKRKWEMTPAQAEKWENVYVAPDASLIQVQSRAGAEEITPRWRTFGQGYATPQANQVGTVPGDIGFAIASPLLALAEGTRTITLRLGFQAENFDEATIRAAIEPPAVLPFRFQLSTEKEMVAVNKVTVELSDSPIPRALKITLMLDEQFPVVAPMATGPGIQTPWPVLRIMLADLLPEDANAVKKPLKSYRPFQHLALEKIDMKVEVGGITQLLLQNDDGILNPKKPFEPFGMAPVVGTSLYLAHPELCLKNLDLLTLEIEWLGAPDNLRDHYLGYKRFDEIAIDPTNNPSTSPFTNNKDFKARLKLYDNRLLSEIGDVQIFSATVGSETQGASDVRKVEIQGETIRQQYPGYDRALHPTMAEEVLDWSRYWQLELSTNFQYDVYVRAAAGCAQKEKSATDHTPKPYIVNPPYTPKIKRLKAGYVSSLHVDLAKDDLAQQPDRFYHLEPFGYRDMADSASKPYPFLPQFDNEGELLIGIKELAPPQNLALLFQMAEGSADPDLAREPVHWEYLDGNTWRSLEEGRLLSDTTDGLLNSGIIRLNLPAVKASTLLPSSLYWIRATIARNSRSVEDTVDIKTQAVPAIFTDRGNDPNRLSQPLQPRSITGPAEPLAQVKAIHQPYTSFGGKSPEQAGAFYTRASERLRHKDRALTVWDYEHMVLEAFPGIYKVKCLPVGTSEDPRLRDAIQVIVVPDIQGRLPFDPFEPKLPAGMLAEIEQHLTGHAPPSIRLIVKNPAYVRLKLKVDVRLRPGAEQGYYKKVLNEELRRYVSPWAYDRSAEIVFGGMIKASLIINFLEERPYVDYVAGLQIFTSLDGRKFNAYDELAEESLGPDAILVSEGSHEIIFIPEEEYEPEFFAGINYMTIELDFEIA